MINKSELRQDLVSGDWILIAPGRARRPADFVEKIKPKIAPLKNCPFENLKKSGNWPPIITYTKGKRWLINVIPNKYPAVIHDSYRTIRKRKGPYTVISGVGYHDLVVTRDHYQNFPKLSSEEANLVFRAFQNRYLMFLRHKDLQYTAIFHNWGVKAGASIYHPHYQIMALPVVPPDIRRSLAGAYNFYELHKKCVHCLILDFEKKQKKRIVFENRGAVAFAPFASHSPFEIRIFPKRHLPFFEDTLNDDLTYVVEALQASLKKLEKILKQPDYNFFIHTAPLKDKRSYLYYHWHIEILPKVSVPAGFELETGIDINVVDPDTAARFIRNG